MKILFVTSYPLEYNTSANIRNMGLIQGLRENGHEISTFSIFPADENLFSGTLLSFPFFKRYWIGSKTTVSVDPNKKTLKGKIKKFVFNLMSNWMVYDSKALSAKSIKVGMINEEYDIVISSSDPKSAHLFAEKIINTHPGQFHKWIQYWGDPFTNDISNQHRHSAKKIMREEKRLMGLADKVVYVSPFTRDEIAAKYANYSEKMAFLPIPFYKKEKPEQVETDSSLIGYLGDYSSKNRNILPFVDAIKQTGYKAAIAGTSDLTIEPTEKLNVYGRLHGKDIEELSAKVGVFVCICNLYGTQIPGKVYHYVDSGKPILIILDGDRKEELKKYFESFNRFYMCENNTEAIAYALRKIMEDYHHFDTPQSLASAGIAKQFII